MVNKNTELKDIVLRKSTSQKRVTRLGVLLAGLPLQVEHRLISKIASQVAMTVLSVTRDSRSKKCSHIQIKSRAVKTVTTTKKTV